MCLHSQEVLCVTELIATGFTVSPYPISYVFKFHAIRILCFVLNFIKNHIILTAYLIHNYTSVRLPQFLRCVGPHHLGGREKAGGKHIFCVPVGSIFILNCGPRVVKAQNLFL